MSAGPGRFSPRLLLVLWERESLSVSDRPASLGHSWLLRENEGDVAGSRAKREVSLLLPSDSLAAVAPEVGIIAWTV